MNYHVRVANGDRGREALEGFLLHCYVVAGKKASVQVAKLNRLLRIGDPEYPLTPFESLRKYNGAGVLMDRWREEGLGKYAVAGNGLPLLIEVDPMTVTMDELGEIPGIGPKTARYFMLYARDVECAALDTHILKLLRDAGVADVPKSTPQAGRRYRALERCFIDLAHSLNLSPQQLDNVAWQFYSGEIDKTYPNASKLKPLIFFLTYAKSVQEEQEAA